MAEAYLSALRELPADAHGPAVSIVLDNVSLSLDVPIAETGMSNLFAASLKFFSPFSRTPQRRLDILQGISGVLNGGTSTLIIGNAGGGKTCLLRRLSARDGPGVQGSPGVSGGRVLWNGVVPDAKSARKLAAFAPQIDVHEPLLTVRETLNFAADSCLAPLPAGDPGAALRAKLVDSVIDTLGLRECENVLIGDDMVRGCSGGQKKRVTLAETLVQGARILALDEVTNGLDSSVALVVCTFLAQWARVTGGVVVAALQAPTPEVLRSFDKVLILSDGRCLYHGPPADMAHYFAQRGYVCPDFMDIAGSCGAIAASDTG